MKKLLTKKMVLIAALVYVVFSGALFFVSETCGDNWCRVHDTDLLGKIFFTFLPFIPVFFFSLITYKMRDEVFEHWITFAKWGVPVLMFLTYLILGGGNQGGLGIESAYGNSFDALLLVTLYAIFCGISIYRIVSKYRELK